MAEKGPGQPIRELTDPIPLGEDTSSVETILGKHADIHYIYVCSKVGDKKSPSHFTLFTSPVAKA